MNIGSRLPVNQLAGEALMVPLGMVVRDELANRAAKMAFTERDHAIEALLSDRSNEPLRVGVTVGCAEWRPMTRTPSFSRKSRTARLHFRSRSQIMTRPRPPRQVDLLGQVTHGWTTNASSG